MADGKPGRPKLQKTLLAGGGISHDKITIEFNEVLFRLWLCGKTKRELLKMFKYTANEFTMGMLNAAMEKYHWEKRRGELTSETMSYADNLILIQRQKQLNAISMIMDMNIYKIEDAYKKFLCDPTAFLADKDNVKACYWIIDNLNDLKNMFSFYREHLAKGEGADGNGVLPPMGQIPSNVSINNVLIGDAEARGEIFSVLKKIADTRTQAQLAAPNLKQQLSVLDKKKDDESK